MLEKFKVSYGVWTRLVLVMLTVSGCAGPGVGRDIDEVLSFYRDEASKLKTQQVQKSWAAEDLPKVPMDFNPWWHTQQEVTFLESSEKQQTTLEDLYIEALAHSSQIRVFSDLPLIRRTGIQEAKGTFDTTAFVEMKYENKSDPVGSTLTTGNNSSRFQEETYPFRTGLRKKVITGGEVELSQEISRTGNNSRFFTPNPQGNAEISLRYTQPLLQGAGVKYNQSIVKVAELDSDVAVSEFLRQTESHLVEISRSYWSLYMARAIYLQKKKLVEETGEVVEELESRSDFDAKSSQLARARAAFSERRATLVRSELAVRNAQDRIKALVNAPHLFENSQGEMIPMDAPFVGPVNVDLMDAAHVALENRPEITQAFTQLKAAAIRESMSRNEVLPKLNVFVEGYLAGLAGRGRWADAVGNQYSEGGPGYAIGMYAEFPLENNVGRARLERRKLESRQQLNSVRTTIETILLELKVSVREVNTALRDLQAKYETMLASEEELTQFQERRGLEAGDEMTTSAYLTFLLDSQDRQALAQEEFVRSMVTYNVSIINLERSKGTLLAYENIDYQETVDPATDLPVINLVKNGVSNQSDSMRMGSGSLPVPVAIPEEMEPELEESEASTLESPFDDSTNMAETEGMTIDVAGSGVDPRTVSTDDELIELESVLPESMEETVSDPEAIPVPELEPLLDPVEVDEPEITTPEIDLSENEIMEPVQPATEEPVNSVVFQSSSEARSSGSKAPYWILGCCMLITGVVFGVNKIRK